MRVPEPQQRSARVLHLVLSLAPGGTERLVIEIVRRLKDRVPMRVACLDEPGEWAREILDLGVEVWTLGRRPGFRPSFARSVTRAVQRHKATVLHCHQYSPFVYGTLSRALLHHARVVYTEHGRLAGHHPTMKRATANRLLGRMAHRVVAVSEELRRAMIGEGFDGQGVDVIYNGVVERPRPTAEHRASARRQIDIPPRVLAVGAVARLDPVKDLGTLLRAFSEVRKTREDAVVVIVGEGPMRVELERMAASTLPPGAVKFTGHRRDVDDLLPAFDIFANSSTTEGISLTMLEAMAASLPVVATSVGGTPEVVVDGHTGLLVAPGDPASLASAIQGLAEDPVRRAAMGDAGRTRVERRFRLDDMIDRYRLIYEELSA